MIDIVKWIKPGKVVHLQMIMVHATCLILPLENGPPRHEGVTTGKKDDKLQNPLLFTDPMNKSVRFVVVVRNL